MMILIIERRQSVTYQSVEEQRRQGVTEQAVQEKPRQGVTEEAAPDLVQQAEQRRCCLLPLPSVCAWAAAESRHMIELEPQWATEYYTPPPSK